MCPETLRRYAKEAAFEEGRFFRSRTSFLYFRGRASGADAYSFPATSPWRSALPLCANLKRRRPLRFRGNPTLSMRFAAWFTAFPKHECRMALEASNVGLQIKSDSRIYQRWGGLARYNCYV